MTFVQQWSTSGAPLTGSVTRTGPATVVGNRLFVQLIIRQNTIPDFEIVDSAGNADWELLEATVVASGLLATFTCESAASITSLTVNATNAGVPAAVAMTFFVSEYSDAGPLLFSDSDAPMSGGLVGPLSVPAGALVLFTGGTSVTTRTWTYSESGMTATQRNSYSGASVYLVTSNAYPAAGDVSAGYAIASGADVNFGMQMFVFGEPVEAIEPEHEATVMEVNAAVGWTPSAGTVLTAISDDNPATFITSEESPSNQLLDVDIEPMLPPDENMSAKITLFGIRATAPTTTANVTVMLYNGATLRATSSPIGITSTPTDLDVTFPSGSIVGVNWLSLRVVVSVTATG